MSTISSIHDLPFVVDIKSDLLNDVRFLPSPYCDDRPGNTLVDMIVIHGISLPPGELDSTNAIEQFFCGSLDCSQHSCFTTISDLKVSAHLLIDRKGQVTQFVPFSKRAWHAGQSYFRGRTQCNDFSIGIELQGTDDIPYEKVQYETLAHIVAALSIAYPLIVRDRIIGHSDIAPGRKTDPGPAFDWKYLDCLLSV